ncbi:hypothetical protein ACOMHN_054145 [Nucella lapillus]
MADIKVFYFHEIRGRGEFLRLLLTAAGVQFEDVRVSMESWGQMDVLTPDNDIKKATPFGQLPYVMYHGKKLGQSIPVASYLAKKHGLYGSTAEDALRQEEVMHLVEDLRLPHVKDWVYARDPDKKSWSTPVMVYASHGLRQSWSTPGHIKSTVMVYASHGLRQSWSTPVMVYASHGLRQSWSTPVMVYASHGLRQVTLRAQSRSTPVMVYASHGLRQSWSTPVMVYASHGLRQSWSTPGHIKSTVMVYASHGLRQSWSTPVMVYASHGLRQSWSTPGHIKSTVMVYARSH